MKILNIQPFDYFSSIQRRSMKVAFELEKDVDTVFVTPREGSSFTKVALDGGFKVYKTSSLRPVFIKNLASLIHNLRWVMGIPRSFVDLYKIIHVEKPDIIQINGFVCIQEAFIAALCNRRKFLWHLIGTTIYPRPLLAMFLPLIKSARARIFVAKKLVSYFFCGSDDWIIQEPVDYADLSLNKLSQSELASFKNPVLTKEHVPIIGFIGYISPQKGLEYLIKSIPLIKKAFPEVKFFIVGGSNPHQRNYYLHLLSLIEELQLTNVFFAGFVKKEEIPVFLSKFDVFMSPSIYEGTPVTILEAMAMGCPVVATDVGGVSEEVVNGETGILVQSKSPQALADAVIYLLKNKEKRLKMGIKAKYRVQNVFSLKRCAIRHKELYDLICK